MSIGLAVASWPALSAPPPDTDSINSAEEITAAALAQIRGQDKLIQQLKQTTARQQAQIEQLQRRLERADAVLGWLAGGLVLSLAAAVALGLRRGPVSPRGATVAVPAVSPDSGAALAVPAPEALSYAAAAGPVSGTTVAGLAPIESVAGRVAPMVALAAVEAPAAPVVPASTLTLGTGVPPREVSVEELLDLEQQVDFFIVLGQDDAAIDLLVGHIRATGGTSAVPYLRLLEIYRDRGDEGGYDRIRTRFNSRFNAEVPPWGGSLDLGRRLEDYAEVVEQLQVLWHLPQAALDAVDGLLRAGAAMPPFDLPAFRDLLMLHGLAGDLLAQQVVELPAAAAAAAAAPVAAAVPPEPMPALAAVAPLVGTSAQRTTAWRMPPPRAFMGSGFGALGRGSSSDDGAPWRRPVPEVDLLLPLGEDDADGTAPRPWIAEPPQPWQAGLDISAGVDIDLHEAAPDPRPAPPAPREFKQPAAFHDVDLSRDQRRSDFAGLDELPDPTGGPRRSR